MDNVTSYRAILAALAEVDTPEGNFAYVILGAGLTACNVLIFAAIMTHRALRNHKEYALLGLLVFFNSLIGCGFVSAGVYRLLLLEFSPSPFHLIDRYQCFHVAHTYFFAGSPCAASLLLPFIALDRLLAVVKPLLYYSLRIDYACYIMIFAITFYLSAFAFAVSQGLLNPGLVSGMCETRSVFGPVYKQFECMMVIVGHSAAVVIYILVIIFFRRQSNLRTIFRTTAPTMQVYLLNSLFSDQRSHLIAVQKQARIVRTFGFFAVTTFVTVVLPLLGIFLCEYVLPKSERLEKLNETLYIALVKIGMLNPTLNVFVYALRHNEIFLGVRTMLIGQTMPDTTDQWWTKQQQQTQQPQDSPTFPGGGNGFNTNGGLMNGCGNRSPGDQGQVLGMINVDHQAGVPVRCKYSLASHQLVLSLNRRHSLAATAERPP